MAQVIDTHVADVATVVIVFLVALIKGLLWFFPARRGDFALRLCLGFYSLTFAVLWAVTFFRIVGVWQSFAPSWFNWVMRVLLTVFGVGAIVQMVRGAVERR